MQRGFFDKVTPVNFNTAATPHIGLPRYRTVISGLFAFFGPRLLSRTGEQFYAVRPALVAPAEHGSYEVLSIYQVDKWSQTGRPLLEVMADPSAWSGPRCAACIC